MIFQGIDYDMDEEAFSYITAPFNPYQFEMSHLVVSMLQYTLRDIKTGLLLIKITCLQYQTANFNVFWGHYLD